MKADTKEVPGFFTGRPNTKVAYGEYYVPVDRRNTPSTPRVQLTQRVRKGLEIDLAKSIWEEWILVSPDPDDPMELLLELVKSTMEDIGVLLEATSHDNQ